MVDQTVFDNKGNQVTPVLDPAPQGNVNPAPTFQLPDEVKNLVGEGKKYATVEDALKSIPFAQEHIGNLEGQMVDLRDDLSKRIEVQKALDEIKAARPNDATPAPEGLDEQAITTLVKQTVNDGKVAEIKTVNIMQADKLMRDEYGDKASDVLKNKADELGISVARLQDIASESPQAFAQVIGLNNKAASSSAQTTSGSVDTERLSGNAGVDHNTYAYYQKLRRENPKEYNSPATQNEMHRKARELGEAFFN